MAERLSACADLLADEPEASAGFFVAGRNTNARELRPPAAWFLSIDPHLHGAYAEQRYHFEDEKYIPSASKSPGKSRPKCRWNLFKERGQIKFGPNRLVASHR